MKKIIFMLFAAMGLLFSQTASAKKKTLVAYFSATGTTEHVAKMIANATGGELLKIQPTKEYSAADLDWRNPKSRSSMENANAKARPTFIKGKTDPNKYDVIYLGYPNWWNGAPRIINSFVEAYKLKGKTVIPFMTSGGSRIENSVTQLKKLYPQVKWQKGKLLNGATQKSINRWVNAK